MREFQKYARNWILTMAFWATCKIAQPIQPIWQHIFALPWSALKKPPWEFNFFHIFGIPSSSRHEKYCQMLERLFVVFHHPRNIPWGARSPWPPCWLRSWLCLRPLAAFCEGALATVSLCQEAPRPHTHTTHRPVNQVAGKALRWIGPKNGLGYRKRSIL